LVSEQPPSVVVVDDAAEVRMLVKHQLTRSGSFTVVGEAANGREAIDEVGRRRPDVVLLDVSMPVMDGLEALPHVVAASPGSVVVMYSGFEEGGLAQRARALGASAFIAKSAAIDGLPQQLRAALSAAREERIVPAEEAHPPEPHLPENVLDEHLERFREIFEEAAIGLATMTLTGNLVRPNRSLAEIVGRPMTALVGLPYVDLAGPADVAELTAQLKLAQSGSVRFVQLEHAIQTPSAPRRLLATIAPVKDARGRPLYLFLQAQDVTAQRRAEEELRQSEERFRLLVETVQDYAIFMLDPTGHVVSWNAGAERIKGYRASDIIGRHFRNFYPPEIQEIRHPEHELELALRDGHYEEEGWRIRKDGSRFWASVVITAVHNRDGVHIGFAKVTRDMDERRKMLIELEDAAAALATANAGLEVANTQLAQEAADQAQFLAVTAHELRSPVSVLSGSANLLADHWADLTEQERSELFESVRLGAGRLQRLLNDLLTASRLGSKRLNPALQPVVLDEVLTRSVAAVKAATAEADIELDSPPGLTVLGEPDRLAQAVDNLLANAVRHGEPPVRVTAHAVADRIHVYVSDAGTGVEPAVRDRLFQRFATGGRRGGTGLGLFIVRELARAYGGDAWYEPDPAPSGRFVLSLLAAGAPAAPTH